MAQSLICGGIYDFDTFETATPLEQVCTAVGRLVTCLSSLANDSMARCILPPSQVADILERRSLTPERVVEVLTNTTLDFNRLNDTLRSFTAFGNLTNLLGTFWSWLLLGRREAA